MTDLTLQGYSAAFLRERLRTITIDGAGGLEAYADGDCERFMRTVAMIPEGSQRILEIGANPYFTSLLMRWFRPDVEVVYTNFFGQRGTFSQTVQVDGLDGSRETHEFEFFGVNVEEDELPGGPYSCVMFCEVLEHMTNNPMKPMLEISRVLEMGGTLLLTTPNVARLENVSKLMSGLNPYDPYSAFGPYGRHNREYTKHELWHLFKHCGFEPLVLDTFDVSTNYSELFYPETPSIMHLLEFRKLDLGQYHFTRSVKTSEPNTKLPPWLYSSYPATELA